MEFPAEMFVKAVDGNSDLFQFRYDFTLEGKASEGEAPAPVVTELEDGDLLINGYAAVWEGDDRFGENFAPGAFANGIEKFLNGQAALCYHHQHDKCLGKVLELKEEGKGLHMQARVDFQPENSPLRYLYNGIKKGTFSGLSTFGHFTRGFADKARKIVGVDLMEISVTPVPVHPGTSLSVLAGKALVSDLKADHVIIPDFPEAEIREEDLMWAQESIATLDRIFERLSKRGAETPTPTDTTSA